ncbi:MAG TPA: CHAP domain-containing protein [Ktedonobacteraceae bacterium]|nr:CHAP domain-containing protein [Ktedonobacteraceae bacterium]
MATPDPDASPATQPLDEQHTAPHLTSVLAFNDSPRVTRLLADLRTQTGTLGQFNNSTTSLRQPIIIPGSGKRSQGLTRPPVGRKWVISSAIIAILAVLTVLTGLAVAPLATGNGQIFGGIFSAPGSIHSTSNSLNNQYLAAQAATQTALNHTDGYGGSSSNSGLPVYNSAGVAPTRFAYGNCTYWADQEYYNRTGHLVQWIGNADQWAAGAQAAGWIVSSSPHVYSIIVLQPGVEGAGYYGHVAVVEKINTDGSVVTSNMNWYYGGGWDIISTVVFKPGPGVLFVWHP